MLRGVAVGHRRPLTATAMHDIHIKHAHAHADAHSQREREKESTEHVERERESTKGGKVGCCPEEGWDGKAGVTPPVI